MSGVALASSVVVSQSAGLPRFDLGRPGQGSQVKHGGSIVPATATGGGSPTGTALAVFRQLVCAAVVVPLRVCA